ncbi:MAG TPA: hypothetical protein VKE92_01265 [Anaerolineales bacterium]|nr:hypothetical protein [Anaerolineales bacterium]
MFRINREQLAVAGVPSKAELLFLLPQVNIPKGNAVEFSRRNVVTNLVALVAQQVANSEELAKGVLPLE